MSSCDLQANSGRLSGLPGRTGAILQETIEVGDVTAVRRMTVKALGGLAAALALIAAVPASAQNSDAPVDVTAAPPPSSETVGPAQLRDFSLDGTVTRQADRAVVTESDVMLQFDVVVTNSGSAPARDVLVEARMVSAHAGPDAEIAAFFQQPVGKGDRIAAIQPFGKISLKSAVRG